VQTPRFCGAPPLRRVRCPLSALNVYNIAGDLLRFGFGLRPLRTS
jgi:hypothetical protein